MEKNWNLNNTKAFLFWAEYWWNECILQKSLESIVMIL